MFSQNPKKTLYAPIYPLFNLFETPAWDLLENHRRRFTYFYESPEILFENKPDAKGCFKFEISLSEFQAAKSPESKLHKQGEYYLLSLSLNKEVIKSYIQKNSMTESLNPYYQTLSSQHAFSWDPETTSIKALAPAKSMLG